MRGGGAKHRIKMALCWPRVSFVGLREPFADVCSVWWSSISQRGPSFGPRRRLRQPERALIWPERTLCWPEKALCWPERALCWPEKSMSWPGPISV